MATPLPVEKVTTMLAGGPVAIAAATDGLEAGQLHATPSIGGWSAREVLAHLRACADVWGGCIETILTEEAPTIRAVNPRTWIDRTDYLDQPFEVSLAAFTTQREDLLSVLRPLGAGEWSRTATVTGAGRVLERSVRSYAEWLATHERSHLKQVRRIADSIRGAAS